MRKRQAPIMMLYDDRADISLPQLEKIIQALVWLADSIVLPSYARPSTLLPLDQERFIANSLAALAEAGYIQKWELDPSPPQLSPSLWWPQSSKTREIQHEVYVELQNGIQAGVSLYREDMLRGMGRPPRTLVSGISEFVSLRDSLWTVGLARFLDVNYLLSSDSRSLALSSPLRRLAILGSVTEPISKTLMELHGVGPLTVLSVEDIAYLRRYKPAARAVIADVVQDVERDVIASLDQQRYIAAAIESTQRHYAELLGDAILHASKSSTVNNAVGMGITIAGTIFPPLGTLSFAQPLMSWEPHGRTGRQLVVFLAKLKKRVNKRQEAEFRR